MLWPLWLLRKNDRKWLADLCRVLIWDCRGILLKGQNDEIPHSLLGWVVPLNPTPGRTPLRGFSPERMNFILYLLSSFALRWISYHFKFKMVMVMIPVPVGWVARLLPWRLSCCKTIPDSLYHQLWKWRPLSGLCVLQQRWNTLKRRNVRMLIAYCLLNQQTALLKKRYTVRSFCAVSSQESITLWCQLTEQTGIHDTVSAHPVWKDDKGVGFSVILPNQVGSLDH